ncbi:DUF2971 domain-containing protein, partial [Salmonella enterica subsp. enterica serovar Montevideo]|nr:DUF2971 domain-containing protein [Salmonella enterica]ECX1102275.1 DUF2971 domain-containing protein [Salmonella enterica subsp. enterica serovar Montevideo]EEC4017797.1 DUF2971 domain-containing protein [Salmonella enterica subsp. enterica serovar Montevideo]
MYIYKYRRFDENSLNALKNNEIWFSRGVKFNDPFDCSLNVPITLMSITSIRKFINVNKNNSLLLELAKNNEDLIDFIVNQQIEKNREYIENNSIERTDLYPVYELVMASLSRAFICCFSQTATNSLLWSHYSNSHTGFCLRFKKDVLLNDLSLFDYGEVKYTNEPINLMEGLYDNSNPARNIIFTKDENWRYEQEFRLVHQDVARNNEDDYRVCKYSDESIDCIILGYNSSPECYQEIR